MREIKFRAWEPLNKNMHYLDFALYEFAGGLNSHKFVLPPIHQGLQNPYTAMNLEVVKVMQYTGLKDKNGKEIYEKDIVDVYGQKLIVHLGKHAYDTRDLLVGGLHREVYGFYLESPCGSWEVNIAVVLDELEVIGNIFETCELLEGGQ